MPKRSRSNLAVNKDHRGVPQDVFAGNAQQEKNGQSRELKQIADLARREFESVMTTYQSTKDLINPRRVTVDLEESKQDLYNFTSPNYWEFLQKKV